VSLQRLDGKLAGIAVHTEARVAALAGSGLAFRDQGEHQLKGLPGDWRLFAVETAADGPSP
jgi:class 3 adenylate cyclase